MFFGAGNLIFSSYLGIMAGDSFLYAIIEVLFTGVGFVFVGVIAAAKEGGNIEDIANQMRKVFSVTYGAFIMLAFGGELAIPRNVAITIESIELAFF